MSELWEIVKVVPATDACIEWQFCRMKGPRPYGQVQYEGELWYVHRLSFHLHHGPIPPGLDICHSCDNPPCFNPRHVFSGTRKVNMEDAARKGRMPKRKGEDAPYVKLTEAQVIEIRSIYRPHTRGLGYRSLARKYGVSDGAMSAVISGRNWSHLL